MQRAQLGIRLVRHGLRFVVPVLVTSLFQLPASAQIEVRRGVRLSVVVEQPYTIRGSTAQALLTQMQTVSPGVGWTSFRSFARWTYDPEARQSVRGGGGTGRCRATNFEIRFDITESYPVWERPLNAPPNLVTAWESFEDLIRQQREEYRDGLVEDGVEMRSRTRRMEESCNFLQNRMRAVVDEVLEKGAEARREARARGEGVRLRWPPAGYSEAPPPAVLPARPPSPSAPNRDGRLPPTELQSDHADNTVATFEDANLEARIRFPLGADCP